MAAQSFNDNGKDSFPYLQKIHILHNPLSERSVGSFLRNTPMLDKSMVCEFLGGNKKFNKLVCKSFVESFTFSDLTVDQSLRLFLESTVLRGESQQILRILECFSSHFFKQSPGPIKNETAAYVLVSAIIMLNTDAHNSQVKTKMKLVDFQRILKGTNDGTNYPDEFISEIYSSITKNEIKTLPQDLRMIVTDGGIDKIY